MEPIIDDNSYRLNVTNELGYGGKTAFLKNIIGLWLIQESRRQWIREGCEYSFAQLEDMAKAAKPFVSFIDPDAPDFTPAGNIPERIREYCRRTGQPVPQSVGEIMICIYQSLALKYRLAVEELELCTGKHFSVVYMVGGGTKDKFLSQLTACACGRTVCSGPVEATAIGNALIQLIAQGAVKDLDEARRIVRRSENISSFEPRDTQDWNDAYSQFKRLLPP